jgi:thioesterase domain-containing protein
VRLALTFLLLGLLAGCATAPAADTGSLRVGPGGAVLLFRGWMGRSPGIDPLAEALRSEGLAAHVFRHDQARAVAATLRRAPPAGPLVLVGHSFGADAALSAAALLARDGIPVALTVTFDPNTPPRVPPNVIRALNFHQSTPQRAALPFFRGVPLLAESPATALDNLDVRAPANGLWEDGTDHFTITTNTRVRAAVVDAVRAALPR